LIAKTRLKSDFEERFIRVEKELFGVIDSLIDNPAVNRQSKSLFE